MLEAEQNEEGDDETAHTDDDADERDYLHGNWRRGDVLK